LSRLHEVATERTVQLAAIIEKAIARWWRSAEMGDNGMYFYNSPEEVLDDLWVILDSVDTDAVLREVRAKAWDEGALWAAVECAAIVDESEPWLAPGDNPYREGS
jgi:hypothetical protein